MEGNSEVVVGVSAQKRCQKPKNPGMMLNQLYPSPDILDDKERVGSPDDGGVAIATTHWRTSTFR